MPDSPRTKVYGEWTGVIALFVFGLAMWVGLILSWLGVRV